MFACMYMYFNSRHCVQPIVLKLWHTIPHVTIQKRFCFVFLLKIVIRDFPLFYVSLTTHFCELETNYGETRTYIILHVN